MQIHEINGTQEIMGRARDDGAEFLDKQIAKSQSRFRTEMFALLRALYYYNYSCSEHNKCVKNIAKTFVRFIISLHGRVVVPRIAMSCACRTLIPISTSWWDVVHITPLHASRSWLRRPSTVPASSKSAKKSSTVDGEWDDYLGDVASAFLHSGVLRILGVQSRELEAVADVRRGTHLSERLPRIESERFKRSILSAWCPAGLQQYGVLTYMARRELAYTV